MLRIIRILALATLSTSTLAAQPVIHLGTGGTDTQADTQANIQIDSMEPGGSVALFGAHRRLEGYATVAGGLQEIAVDEDGDGSVAIGLDIDLPLASLWVAVDLASGLFSVSWPEGFEPATLAASGLRLTEHEHQEETLTALAMSGRLLDVFVVRPGDASAVWHRTLANGGPLDVDPDPASMSLLLGDFESLVEDDVEGSPTLASLSPEDLVILLDPTRLGWQVIQGDALLDGLPAANATTAQQGSDGGLR